MYVRVSKSIVILLKVMDKHFCGSDSGNIIL